MKKIAPYIGWGIQLIVFFLLTWLLSTFIFSDEDIIGRLIPLIILSPIWFIALCVAIYPFFLWNEKLKNLYDRIFEFPLTIMLSFSLLQTNIFMIVMFIVICLMPVGFSIALVPDGWDFKWGLVYIVSLVMLLVYTYKAQWLMKFLDFILNVAIRDKWLLTRIFEKSNPRIISYSMMIFIYIIYNFDAFSNNSLEIDINLLKEVFVTFIAVDTLIQMFILKKKER